jgi:aspartyl protease family protein
MGLQDRDYWREEHRRGKTEGGQLDRALRQAASTRGAASFAKMLLVWLAIAATLYVAFDRYLATPKAAVTAAGELRIPRARDGHFYVKGMINGGQVEFLVDTGASLVMVSDALARNARVTGGVPAEFQTAKGAMQGRIVHSVPVTVGPLSISATSVGVGLIEGKSSRALLGQAFLSNFNVSISRDEMVIGPR